MISRWIGCQGRNAIIVSGEHKSTRSAAPQLNTIRIQRGKLEEHFAQRNKKYECIPLGKFEGRPEKLRDLRL